RIEESVSRLSKLKSAAGLLLEFPAVTDETRFAYAVKRLSSAFRGGSPGAPVGLLVKGPIGQSLEGEIDAYVDALADREDRPPAPLQTIAARWAVARLRGPRGAYAVSDAIRAIEGEARGGLAVSFAALLRSPEPGQALGETDFVALARLQAYLTD